MILDTLIDHQLHSPQNHTPTQLVMYEHVVSKIRDLLEDSKLKTRII